MVTNFLSANSWGIPLMDQFYKLCFANLKRQGNRCFPATISSGPHFATIIPKNPGIEGLKRGGLGESCSWGADDPLFVGRTGEGGEQELATVHASLPPHSTLQSNGGGALGHQTRFWREGADSS